MAFIVWFMAFLLFLVKITRYGDPSWFTVASPLIGYYGVLVGYVIGVLIREGYEDHRRHKSLTARGYDTSHIQPLDSIKNPRKS